MGSEALIVPDWLRFSCTGCGLCCRRGWVIHVGCADRERLLAQNWVDLHPHLAERELIVRCGRASRFAVDEAGCCAFLDEESRCLIHSDLGYEQKVLACQVYPYCFTLTGGQVRVGLHFSCPAVVDMKGPPLGQQLPLLRRLWRETRDEMGLEDTGAEGTAFDHERGLTWERLSLLESRWDEILSAEEMPLLRRVLALGVFVDQLEDRYEEGASEDAFAETVAFAERRAWDEGTHCGLQRGNLGLMERLMLRLLVGLASEMAVPGLLSPSFVRRQMARTRRLGLAMRFFFGHGSLGVGDVRATMDVAKSVKCYPLAPDVEEALARYLRTRLASRTYFGREGWGLDVLHGTRLLLSLYAVCVVLARLVGGARGADVLAREDMATALMLCDHTYGHMATFQLGPVRRVMRVVHRSGWVQRAALYAAL